MAARRASAAGSVDSTGCAERGHDDVLACMRQLVGAATASARHPAAVLSGVGANVATAAHAAASKALYEPPTE